MNDIRLWMEIGATLAVALSAFLLVRFKVDQMEKDMERIRHDDREEWSGWLRRVEVASRKFEDDVVREIKALRDFRHDFPPEMHRWQQMHEAEAAGERLKLHEKISDMRVSIAANEQKFEQIMDAIDDNKRKTENLTQTIDGLRTSINTQFRK